MARLLVVVLILASLALTVAPAIGQSALDAQMASAAAYELSRLEAANDFNALYDRIHPDAHAVIPRAAAVGWFENDYAPRGPGVSSITGVEFGPWTWDVTGQTYPYTATVSYQQPFADGSVVEDVVRLVQDERGEWRWFFGRSREFVDEQIARYVTVQPQPSGSTSTVDVAAGDLDTFWRVAFEAAGRAYAVPRVVALDTPIASACGGPSSAGTPAAYCPIDGTIYYATWFFTEQETQFGDFAWVNILAHEWGHHIQNSLGLVPEASNAFELQADCLAGAYARDAGTRGLLDPGDVTEAVMVSAAHGDDPMWPQDQPGAHGTNDDRITSFMRGYLDGFIGCQLPIAGSTAPRNLPSAPGSDTRLSVPGDAADLVALLPTTEDVPGGLVITDDLQRTLAEVAANYSDPAETERRFAAWGWTGNVARSFGLANGAVTLPGVPTSVYVSIHRFGSADAAAKALDYSFADQVATTGALETEARLLGDYTRALRVDSADGNEITIYAQQGTLLVRLTTVAIDGDPMSPGEAILGALLREVSP